MTPHSVCPLPAQFPVPPFKPLTKADVASILKVTPRCVEQWVEQGKMPRWRKIGDRSYWHPDVFYGWLATRLKADEPHHIEVASVTPASVRPKKSKADSGVHAQNARRLLKITQAAGEAAKPEKRAE